MDQLDRDWSIEIAVVGQEHLTHAADTEPPDHAMGADPHRLLVQTEEASLDVVVEAGVFDARRPRQVLSGLRRLPQGLGRVFDRHVCKAAVHNTSARGVSMSDEMT